MKTITLAVQALRDLLAHKRRQWSVFKHDNGRWRLHYKNDFASPEVPAKLDLESVE